MLLFAHSLVYIVSTRTVSFKLLIVHLLFLSIVPQFLVDKAHGGQELAVQSREGRVGVEKLGLGRQAVCLSSLAGGAQGLRCAQLRGTGSAGTVARRLSMWAFLRTSWSFR